MWRTTPHTSNVPREKPKQKSTLPPQSFKGNPIPPPPTNKGEVHLSLRNPGAYMRSSLLKKKKKTTTTTEWIGNGWIPTSLLEASQIALPF